jgi:ATP-dependent RNA helicase SUPV3L1/SUV3
VRLYGDLGHTAARERAARRLDAFVAGETARRLGALRKLEAAVADGRIKGLARGIAYRLLENGGVLDRAQVRAEVKALSQVERRALRSLGVRLGAFSLFLPALLRPQALSLAQAFAAREAAAWKPDAARPSPLAQGVPARAAAAYGLLPVGGLAVPVEQLERLDELMRAAPRAGGGVVLSDQAREELGWSEAEAKQILRGLGFAPASKPKAGEPLAWRRRSERPQPMAAKPTPHSPFAALAALQAQPAPAKRDRMGRPRRRRRPKAQAG